jgi:hypothetical protein
VSKPQTAGGLAASAPEQKRAATLPTANESERDAVEATRAGIVESGCSVGEGAKAGAVAASAGSSAVAGKSANFDSVESLVNITFGRRDVREYEMLPSGIAVTLMRSGDALAIVDVAQPHAQVAKELPWNSGLVALPPDSVVSEEHARQIYAAHRFPWSGWSASASASGSSAGRPPTVTNPFAPAPPPNIAGLTASSVCIAQAADAPTAAMLRANAFYNSAAQTTAGISTVQFADTGFTGYAATYSKDVMRFLSRQEVRGPRRGCTQPACCQTLE